jgi:hypothetical protein
VRDKNGPEANWLTSEFETKAAYKAGGGVLTCDAISV